MLLRGGLDVHLLRLDAQRPGQRTAHLLPVGSDLGGLRHQRGVDIYHLPPLLRQGLHHPLQQRQAGDVQKGIVAVREQSPDIVHTGSAQQGIHHRMGQHVRIGVAVQPLLPRDGNTA